MVKCIFKAVKGYNYQIMYISFSEDRFVLRNSACPDEIPTFETSLFAKVPGSKRIMKPPMNQENKHSTYFRILFLCSSSYCETAQSARLVGAVRTELNLSYVRSTLTWKYDQRIPQSHIADQAIPRHR